jgi:hypothetical protein
MTMHIDSILFAFKVGLIVLAAVTAPIVLVAVMCRIGADLRARWRYRRLQRERYDLATRGRSRR